MSDDNDSSERDEISRNYEETVTGDDEESDERDLMVESKEDALESEESENDERDQIEYPEELKRIDSQK